MKNKKLITVFITVGMLCAFCCVSVSANVSPEKTVDTNLATGIDNSSIGAMFASTPKKIKTDRGNFVFLANVHLPDSDVMMKLKGTPKKFDDKFYNDLNKDNKFSLKNRENGCAFYKGSDGKSFICVGDGSVTYEDKVKTAIYDFPVFSFSGLTEFYTDRISNQIMKIEPIIKAKEFCGKYGIDVNPAPISSFYFDYHTMNKMAGKLIFAKNEDQKKHIAEDVEKGRYTIKETPYVKSDEGCLLTLRQGYKGLYFLYDTISDGDGSVIADGSYVDVLYSEAGPVRFFAKNVYDITETGERYENIIDLNKAFEVINEKYNKEVLKQTIEIYNIYLEYVPVNTDKQNEVEFIPAWRFKGSGKNYMVNAVTGDLIAGPKEIEQ